MDGQTPDAFEFLSVITMNKKIAAKGNDPDRNPQEESTRFPAFAELTIFLVAHRLLAHSTLDA